MSGLGFPRVRVGGAEVDVISWDDAISSVGLLATQRAASVVCLCNVHMSMESMRDPNLKLSLSSAELVLPDGAPIAWFLRRVGYREQDRIDGPDFMWRYLAIAEKNGFVVSFFGGTSEVLGKLVEKINDSYPLLKIGCVISPPVVDESYSYDNQYIRELRNSSTDVLFVCLGCPKQEKWMHKARDYVDFVMIGVGAAFEYNAGVRVRAPRWVRVYGLEWMARLISEPRRLWRRYFFTNSKFILYIFRYWLSNLLRRK